MVHKSTVDRVVGVYLCDLTTRIAIVAWKNEAYLEYYHACGTVRSWNFRSRDNGARAVIVRQRIELRKCAC